MPEKSIDVIRDDTARALENLVLFSAWQVSPVDKVAKRNAEFLLLAAARTFERTARWCRLRAAELRHPAAEGDMAVTENESKPEEPTDKKGIGPKDQG